MARCWFINNNKAAKYSRAPTWSERNKEYIWTTFKIFYGTFFDLNKKVVKVSFVYE